MKRKYTIFCLNFITMFLVTLTSNATIWRVNNAGDVTANFKEIRDAVASSNVVSGDTLYIEGSSTRYLSTDLNKKLVLIGPGYFLAENPDTQYSNLPANVVIDTQTGSSGSVFMGLTFSIDVSFVSFDQDNLVVRNCLMLGETRITGNNILFIQNYVQSRFRSTGNNTVKYNYISQTVALGTAGGLFENNIIGSTLDGSNVIVRNNIFLESEASNPLITGTNNTIEFNLSALNQLDETASNIRNADLSKLFVGSSNNSTDGQWKLQEGSIAKAKGKGGIDLGIFGGNDAYVLSGIPNIPRIIDITVPSEASTTTGLTVVIKVKSN